ncbi:MAG TPA: tetratricopeptide repeat protein [Thermoanaerobaculia bacterium]|nr:tetratricopeptide repeat protein [Thermoanaerobaculia bacterium]
MAEPSRRIFPALSSRPFETWQVGAVRLPAWFPRDGGDPFRPWTALCLNLESGTVMASEPGPEEEISSLLESAVSRAGRKWRSRPARIQVADVAWARALDGILSPHGVTVEVQPELPELSGILANLRRHMAPDDDLRPGPLTGAGVTLERLAAFVRAAAGFLNSSGWRHLNEEDRVRIEAPDVEPELLCFALAHDGGRSAPELRFFPEPEVFTPDPEALPSAGDPPLEAELDGEDYDDDYDDDDDDDEDFEDDDFAPSGWTVELLKPWEAPPEDVDLWEKHGLPWVGDGFIPVAGFWEDGLFLRPDHRQLAFFEGLLTALASLAEGDLDAGTWEEQAATAGGPVRFVLSLPDLLEPLEKAPAAPLLVFRFLERSLRQAQRKGLPEDIEDLPLEPAEPETPEERAEALLDSAYTSLGRRAVLLARQALEIWPDFADAYNFLARRASDPESAGRFYELGMAAGERAVGPEAFAEIAGAEHFWGVLETRPYMRARQGLADTLVERKLFAEAAEHFQAMLRLNPGDNQGVRHSLVNLLIALDRDEEARELLDRYAWDTMALLDYPRALLRFRQEGDSPEARRALKRAVQANRFVPGLLLHTRGVPPPAGFYSPGREDEAVFYLVLSCETWAGTAGALDWLRRRTAAPARPKAKSKTRKRKKKRK